MSEFLPDLDAIARELSGVCAASTGDEARDAYARATWSTLIEPGDGVAGALVAALGAEAALEVAFSDRTPPVAAELTARQVADGRARWRPRRGEVAEALERARRSGVGLLTPNDPDWPGRCADLGPHAPLCLWTRGDTRLLRGSAPAYW